MYNAFLSSRCHHKTRLTSVCNIIILYVSKCIIKFQYNNIICKQMYNKIPQNTNNIVIINNYAVTLILQMSAHCDPSLHVLLTLVGRQRYKT